MTEQTRKRECDGPSIAEATETIAPDVLRFERCRLDPVARQLTRDGVPVPLSGRLFETLLCVAGARGALVTREALLARVWPDRTVEENSVRRAISEVRGALRDAGMDRDLIVTISGRGYRLAAQVSLECAGESAAAPEKRVSAPRGEWRRSRLIAAVLSASFIAVIGCVAALQTTRRAAAPVRSIAILRFSDAEGGRQSSFLADSIADELATGLSRVPDLLVAATPTGRPFESGVASPVSVGRALHVAHVVEGTLQQRDGRIAVAVRLVDAVSGQETWAARYERDAASLAGLETEICTAILAGLNDGRKADVPFRLKLSASDDPGAYEAFLQGLLEARSASVERRTEAERHFDAALRLDPHFARALAQRSLTRAWLAAATSQSDLGWRDRKLEEASEDADAALALDASLAEAHAAKAYTLEYRLGHFAEAGRELERALELAPSNAAVTALYAYHLARVGRMDLAVATARRAVSLDPLSPQPLYAWARILSFAGRTDTALTTLHYADTLTRDDTLGRRKEEGLIAIYNGDTRSALSLCADRVDFGAYLCLAWAYAKTGDAQAAATYREKLTRALGDNGAYQYVELHAMLGNTREATTWLQRAYDRRDPGLANMRADPMLASLRKETEYKVVLHRVGLE